MFSIKISSKSIDFSRTVINIASVNKKISPNSYLCRGDRYNSVQNEHSRVKVGLWKNKVFHSTMRESGRVIGLL